jgi:multidrug transporter EmrE-like cation transporter
MFLLYSVVGSLLYVGGDILGKYWALNDRLIYFCVGLALYSAGGAFMFLAIKEDSLTMALLVMPSLAITLSLLAGYFIFGERISSVQYVAAAVILLAVVTLLWNPEF